MTLSNKFTLRTRLALYLGIVLVAGLAVSLAFLHAGPHKTSRGTVSAASTKESLAVLPFLDLTDGMKEEEFADGMTEELIDKLSRLPGMQVPAPTSSFYYKNKQLPVADIARAMGVVYVLDGSIRKSGNRIRVAARLMRADNAYVIWTETYDRPADDLLWVQDDIATRVATALQRSNHWGKDSVSDNPPLE
jgi:TolB-like protein